MEFLFNNLPKDIIKHILLYDERFIMRKGNIISIIPKTDYRYRLLNFITLKLRYFESYKNKITYMYDFHNLYNYEGRSLNNPDMIQVNLYEYNDYIKYYIWIGKQYPKSYICNKKQNYYIENKLEYNWIFTEFEYERR